MKQPTPRERVLYHVMLVNRILKWLMIGREDPYAHPFGNADTCRRCDRFLAETSYSEWRRR